MQKRKLKINCGSAKYDGIFEQNTTKRYAFKVFIGIPAEVNHISIRTCNAVKVAQYLLQCTLLNDSNIFDRCSVNKKGWEYEPETKVEAS